MIIMHFWKIILISYTLDFLYSEGLYFGPRKVRLSFKEVKIFSGQQFCGMNQTKQKTATGYELKQWLEMQDNVKIIF